MKIAIQGRPASFHDEAAHQFFGSAIELICCETFAETFGALASGEASYAMAAIENSLFGPISPVYDLLLEHRPWIFGETYLHIHQCLIGLPSADLQDVEEVYSHTAALAQCEAYLNTHLAHAKRFEHYDTAGAVADIAQWNDKKKVAIASATAAKHYGLKVIAPNIETHHRNFTRFIALAKQSQPTDKATKTSIVLRTANHSGALYHALGAFDAEQINLTLLHSRPIVGQHQRYMFYADFEAGIDEASTKRTLKTLHEQGCEVTILGSYPAATLPTDF